MLGEMLMPGASSKNELLTSGQKTVGAKSSRWLEHKAKQQLPSDEARTESFTEVARNYLQVPLVNAKWLTKVWIRIEVRLSDMVIN